MKQSVKQDPKKWADLHEQLQDMLAGYADNELNDEQTLQVEAHLAGCEDCRNDLARQTVLSHRLDDIPLPKMSASLHQQLDQALDNSPPKNTAGLPGFFWEFPASITRHLGKFATSAFMGISGWMVATALVIVMLLPSLGIVGQHDKNQYEIPMVEDALVQYHEMKGKMLPVSSHSASNADLPKLPLEWPNAHLLASWKTQISGAPAQAFAIRSGDNIVFQYQIDEAVFFRTPEVRKAVSQAGSYRVRSNNTDVLALPLEKAGLLVVGPAGSLPDPGQLTPKLI